MKGSGQFPLPAKLFSSINGGYPQPTYRLAQEKPRYVAYG